MTCSPTGEEALGAEEADAEPQDGQLVQAGDDIFWEGQQAGEPVQLRVETLAVAFGRVGLGAVGRGRFDSGWEGKIKKPKSNLKILLRF